MKEITLAISNFFRYRFNLDEDKANEDEIIDGLKRNVEFKGTNLWGLIFAILIASIGLNVNSTAVIIGAMLISPIMGPIMGIGLGAGIFDFSLIRFSLKNLGVAVIIALVSSAVYFKLTPIQQAQSELLTRTSPTLWDVLIALFGGLAGIIASSRRNISNTIPGVAIATALMPPLCTAGYGIATGNLYFFAGAFYLFIINSVFISLSTFLIVRFLKFRPVKFVNKAVETRIKRVIWFVAVLTILPSLFLAYRFVQQEIFKQNLQSFVRVEIEGRNLYVINQKVRPLTRQAILLIYNDGDNDSLLTLIKSKKSLYNLENDQIEIKATLNTKKQQEPLNNALASTESQGYTAIMIDQDKKIKNLEKSIKSNQIKDSLFYSEFFSLFGKVDEISLSRIGILGEDNRKGTYFLVYIHDKRKFRNRNQIQQWIKARFRTDSVKVIIERN